MTKNSFLVKAPYIFVDGGKYKQIKSASLKKSTLWTSTTEAPQAALHLAEEVSTLDFK